MTKLQVHVQFACVVACTLKVYVRCVCLAGEGPCGLIVCPSRELARQTFEVIEGYTRQLASAGYPQLHTLLCIGGIDMKAQTDQFKHAGETVCLVVPFCA